MPRSRTRQLLTAIQDQPNIKDKNYKRYAAGIDKVLALFDTALEEWADYISFLNKLLKVCGDSIRSRMPARAATNSCRLSKLDRRISPGFQRPQQSQSDYHNASTPPYPQGSTRKLLKFMPTSLRRSAKMACPEISQYGFPAYPRHCRSPRCLFARHSLTYWRSTSSISIQGLYVQLCDPSSWHCCLAWRRKQVKTSRGRSSL
jgi:hypothetical protein